MTSFKINNFIFLLIFAFLSVMNPLFSADRKVYQIFPSSQIVFKGKSNINTFSFRSDQINGRGCIDTTVTALDSLNEFLKKTVNGFFQVRVKTFDSGHNRMNRDMYEALKEEDHKNIRFLLESVKFDQYIDQTEALFRARGFLQVAGVENRISLTVRVNKIDENLYHLQGSKQILMTDFDIEPPQALLGLVQTKDKLTVEFDIYTGRRTGDVIAANIPCEEKLSQLRLGSTEEIFFNAD